MGLNDTVLRGKQDLFVYFPRCLGSKIEKISKGMNAH